MQITTCAMYSAQLADTVDLQELLDKLADFLLHSGFAAGPHEHPYWRDFGGEQDQGAGTLERLRAAILRALMDSGILTREMPGARRGESTGDAQKGADLQRQLSELLDAIVQRLVDEGMLTVQQAPQVPAGHQALLGPDGLARHAEGHAPDHHDRRPQAVGADAARRAGVRELDGARPPDPEGDAPRGGAVPPRRRR